MENIIERVARHADIDTRRVMGLPPRKITHWEIPLRTLQRDFDNGIKVNIDERGSVGWVFGNERYTTIIGMSFIMTGTLMGIGVRTERHPDFNDDGTLKKWQTL